MVSQIGIGFGFLDVGDESGGVTGALFEMRRGGRDEGIALQRKGRRLEAALFSIRVGLGKDEDEGLT